MAVVWSRLGGMFDRCGDVLYLSNQVSTEAVQGQIAQRRFLQHESWKQFSANSFSRLWVTKCLYDYQLDMKGEIIDLRQPQSPSLGLALHLIRRT